MAETAFNYEQAKIDAQAENVWVRRKLASNPEAPSEILFFLSTDKAAEVRRAVAENPSTPAKTDTKLARDKDYSVRCALARKAVGEGLGGEKRTDLWRMMFTLLETLAHDKVVRVRQVLSDAFSHPADAPPEIVRVLARDKDKKVAQPVLRDSPVLADLDIVSILDHGAPSWAQEAIAEREKISPAVAEILARKGSVGAITRLVENHGAEIDEPTMERIVKRAPKVKQWHEPLVKRPALSENIILRLARFVAAPLRAVLRKRDGLGSETAEELDRIESGEGSENGANGDAEAMFNAGRLSDEAVSAALDHGHHDFVIDALALRTRYSVDKVRRIVAAKSPRTMMALAWRAKLGARFAMELQKRLAHIPPHEVLNARDGLDYPLTVQEMKGALAMVAS